MHNFTDPPRDASYRKLNRARYGRRRAGAMRAILVVVVAGLRVLVRHEPSLLVFRSQSRLPNGTYTGSPHDKPFSALSRSGFLPLGRFERSDQLRLNTFGLRVCINVDQRGLETHARERHLQESHEVVH